jgi:acetylornithine aminotransferase
VDAIGDDLLTSVRLVGSLLAEAVAGLPGVVEVRGRGLLLGAVVDRPASEVVDACRKRGLLVLSAGDDVVRLAPPLTVERADVEEAAGVLAAALGAVESSA